jgi:hypothetical protein
VYEPEELLFEFRYGRVGNKRKYLPDFGVLQNGEEIYEVHETKGCFSPIDYAKVKAFADDNENPVVLIFACAPKNPKKPKGQAQKRRIERIEPHISRVIRDADAYLFTPIKHLFEF